MGLLAQVQLQAVFLRHLFDKGLHATDIDSLNCVVHWGDLSVAFLVAGLLTGNRGKVSGNKGLATKLSSRGRVVAIHSPDNIIYYLARGYFGFSTSGSWVTDLVRRSWNLFRMLDGDVVATSVTHYAQVT